MSGAPSIRRKILHVEEPFVHSPEACGLPHAVRHPPYTRWNLSVHIRQQSHSDLLEPWPVVIRACVLVGDGTESQIHIRVPFRAVSMSYAADKPGMFMRRQHSQMAAARAMGGRAMKRTYSVWDHIT